MKKKQITKEILIEDIKTQAEVYFKKYGSYDIPRDSYRRMTRYGHAYDKFFRTFVDFKIAAGLASPEVKRVKREEHNIIKKGKIGKARYVVSSIVEGAPYSQQFIDSIMTYCNKNNAKLILLWSKGLSKKDGFDEEIYKDLEPYLTTQFKFNTKLSAIDFMLAPTQLLPLSGLSRFGAGDSSLIVASTKQHMESIPRPAGKIPHLLWSTGTVSLPRYNNTRTGALARQDNTLGALIVEIEDEKRFYIRPVQFVKDGFVDLGIKYFPNGTKTISCEAAILGDLHIPEQDPIFTNAAIDQVNFLKSKSVFIHDLLSINSVNHHNLHEYLARAKMPFTSLEDELKICKKLVKQYVDRINGKTKIYVVASNHDNAFIVKWLNNGDFIKDTENAKIGAEFFLKLLDDRNPIQEYLGIRRLHFLDSRKSKVVSGWECGFHGHAGSNGAKGSINNFAKTFEHVVVAHSHSPGIRRGAVQVGTQSKLDLPYLKGGTTSWLPANCFIYEDGSMQLVTYIDNKWRLQWD